MSEPKSTTESGFSLFGYIKPFKPELKIKEFDTYQAVYCGLCHQLGKAFGPFAKMTLSYDFTFVAMLSMALRENFCGFQKTRCMANPLKKKTCAVPGENMEFVSSCAMVMLYYKVKDNIHDSGFAKKIGCYLLLPFASSARKKALSRHPELDEIFGGMMKDQFELEQQKTVSVDAAAEPTANALQAVFSMLGKGETKKRVLSRFGYLLGRWVYLLDALDDLEDDAKTGSYNPYLLKFQVTVLDEKKKKEILDYGKGTLNVTVAEMGTTFELLELHRYKTILDNIIYLGLKASAEQVLSGENHKKQKKQI